MSDFDERAKDWDEVPGRLERASIVAAAIRKEVILSRKMTALEYGCGTGLLSFALQAEIGPITLADSSSGMLEVVRQKISSGRISNMTTLKLDLTVDRVPSAQVELIYTLMTLHHIPDTAKVLAGFAQMLRPGGRLCIADLEKEDGSFHSNNPDFDGHAGFERAELQTQLNAFGFGNVRFSTCYEIPKNGRVYPLFLAVAEK